MTKKILSAKMMMLVLYFQRMKIGVYTACYLCCSYLYFVAINRNAKGKRQKKEIGVVHKYVLTLMFVNNNLSKVINK